MAYDDRDGPRGRGPEWRGEDGFGGGWGNQVPRPHRFAGRAWREPADERNENSYYRGQSGYGGGFAPDQAQDDYSYRGNPPELTEGGYRLPSDSTGMFGSSARAFAIRRAAARHDPHYHDWRNREIDALDRDYDEYRRENQSRFDREFSDWRVRRGAQRDAVGRVREHMEVVGSDNVHVGTVDKTRGDRIVLTKSDEAAGGVHHLIPCAWIQEVGDKVVLNIDGEEARRRWQNENHSRALFEREDLGQTGPHVLNRSFAGTYPDDK